jgi:hypothetical protein
VSLKSRVVKILTKLERRSTLAEDSVERAEAVVLDVLDMTTELKAVAAMLQATASRLEVAVAEQGKTLSGVLDGLRDERQRRAGMGREAFGRIFEVEQRLDALEREERPTNGAA